MSSDLHIDDKGALLSVASRPYQILSLSGGGYRGLYAATLLESLEEKAGRPLGQVFDLIAGTSIGGILAIGLAAGVPASKLRKAFEEHGDEILRRRYSARGITRTIEAILAIGEGKARLKDLKTPLLVVGVDVITRESRLFETDRGDQNIKLLDVALATSAAPGYFPEHVIGQSVLVDGGLIANAPDTAAIVRALGQRYHIEDLYMLSIGTVGGNEAQVPRSPTGAGLLLRGKDLFLLTISAQQHLAVSLAADALRGRYLRLDAAPSAAQIASIGLDRTGKEACDTLKLLAYQTVRAAEEKNAAFLRLLLNRSWKR
jgi:predicted acylesterase/phospholipase RssA